jgi:HEAT repeat protein
MKTEEKINLLNKYRDLDDLSEKYFAILQRFSNDEDATVRSMAASFFVDFINENSKKTLLKLTEDKDNLVRTEAYDSLSVFVFNDVEKSLKNAIETEPDDLARSYAILSWTDVVSGLKLESKKLIEYIMQKKTLERSPKCALNYCYCLYKFGHTKILAELLEYLKNRDYHVRCSAISLLQEIVDKNNKGRIKKSIEEMLITENILSVKDRAEVILKMFGIL